MDGFMTPSQIFSALHTLLSAHQPVFLWGAPGVGKSQVVAKVAADRGMALRDIRAVLLDPVDLRPPVTSLYWTGESGNTVCPTAGVS